MLPPTPQNQEKWNERDDGVLSRRVSSLEPSAVDIEREAVIRLIEGALRISSSFLPIQGTIVFLLCAL